MTSHHITCHDINTPPSLPAPRRPPRSLCDITTAPPRGDYGSADNPRSPSPSPAKDTCAAAGASSAGGGKLGRGGSGKWGAGGGGAGVGGGGKHGKGAGKYDGSVNITGAAVVHGDSTPTVSGGSYSKRMALTNGHS